MMLQYIVMSQLYTWLIKCKNTSLGLNFEFSSKYSMYNMKLQYRLARDMFEVRNSINIQINCREQ